jgi:hypothetical protein
VTVTPYSPLGILGEHDNFCHTKKLENEFEVALAGQLTKPSGRIYPTSPTLQQPGQTWFLIHIRTEKN